MAKLAKEGRDTRGYEIAANNRARSGTSLKPFESSRYASADVPAAPAQKPVQLASVERQPLPPERISQVQLSEIPARKPVIANGNNIYVQAGAFSQEQNALSLSEKISSIGPSRVYMARVNGAPFFRVRLGPYMQVAQADAALNQLVALGNKGAVLVAD